VAEQCGGNPLSAPQYVPKAKPGVVRSASGLSRGSAASGITGRDSSGAEKRGAGKRGTGSGGSAPSDLKKGGAGSGSGLCDQKA